MSISRDTEYTIMRLSGLSTDDKPTDVKSGSWFREIDTSNEYMFDGTNWVLQTEGGGGGGMMVVNITAQWGEGDDDGVLSADVPYTDVQNAYISGTPILVILREGYDCRLSESCGNNGMLITGNFYDNGYMTQYKLYFVEHYVLEVTETELSTGDSTTFMFYEND